MEVSNESMATLLMVMIPRGRLFTKLWVAFGMVVVSAMANTVNPVNETSMENPLEGTICKIERFKKLGYNVEVKWECEFKQELTMNAAMKSLSTT